MTEKETTTLSTVRKIAMILAVVVGIVAVTVTLFNAFDLWGKFRDIETIRSWVESAGPYGILVYGALVFAQVLILPIPSTVTNFVAILLFEPWVTFLVTTIVTIVGSYVCFLIGRIFGKRLVSWLIGKDKTEKYADLLQKKGKSRFFPEHRQKILCSFFYILDQQSAKFQIKSTSTSFSEFVQRRFQHLIFHIPAKKL